MKAVSKRILMLLLAMFAAAAHAETVAEDSVNCRSAARSNAPVLGVLHSGQYVPVLSRSGAWSYVDPASLPACYVRSDLLVSSAGAPSSSIYRLTTRPRASRSSYQRDHDLYPMPRYASSARRRPSSGRNRPRARGLYDGGGSCPCSGSNICIGPRGGRYCITSGGNKRYGV